MDPAKSTLEREQSERFQRGWAQLKAIDGEAGEQVIESLKEIAPDLFPFVECSLWNIVSL